MIHFPHPLKDETLYSVMARHFLLSQETSATRVSQQLFGVLRARLNCAAPTRLGLFYENVGRHVWSSPEQMLDEHTAVGVLKRWIPSDLYRGIVGRMLQRPDVPRVARIASHVLTMPTSSRFCEACRDEDLKGLGVARWFTHHQLPLSLACHRHGLRLVDRCEHCQRPAASNDVWNPPPLTCRCGGRYDLYRSANDEQRRIAGFMASLQSQSLDISSMASRYRAYRAESDRVGLKTRARSSVLVDPERFTAFASRVLCDDVKTRSICRRQGILGYRVKTGPRTRFEFSEAELLLAAMLFEDAAQLSATIAMNTAERPDNDSLRPWCFAGLRQVIQERLSRGNIELVKTAKALGVNPETIHYTCLRAGLSLHRPLRANEATAKFVVDCAGKGLKHQQIVDALGGMDGHVRAIFIVYEDLIKEGQIANAKAELERLITTGQCATRQQLYEHSPRANAAMRLIRLRDSDWLDRKVPVVRPPRTTRRPWAPPLEQREDGVIELLKAKHRLATARPNHRRVSINFLSWLAFGNLWTLHAMRKQSRRISEVIDDLVESPRR